MKTKLIREISDNRILAFSLDLYRALFSFRYTFGEKKIR